MSKQNKFFTKVLFTLKEKKITAVNIIETYLILGDETGSIYTYEITDTKGLVPVSQAKLNSKIDKILIPPNTKITLVLCSGEVNFFDIPFLSFNKTLIKDKNLHDIFIKDDTSKHNNEFLVVNKKKRIYVYDYEYSNKTVIFDEKKIKYTFKIKDLPKCALWTIYNEFIYSNNRQIFWLYLNSGKTTLVSFEHTIQIINLEYKIAVSNTEITLFLKDGCAYEFNPIFHAYYGGIDFQGFAMFKNHLLALYKNVVHIYKNSKNTYDLVESLYFCGDGNAKFLVTSNNKVIICTEIGCKFNILEFKERLDDEIKNILIPENKDNNNNENNKNNYIEYNNLFDEILFEINNNVQNDIFNHNNWDNNKLEHIQKELNIEKEKNKILEKELCEEKMKNKELENIITSLKKEINENKVIKTISNNELDKEFIYNSILEKDKEIKELKEKLSKFQFEKSEGK